MTNSLQRKVYSYITMKDDPDVDEVFFAFNFVRYGYQSDWYVYTRDDMEDLEKEIKKEIEEYYKLIAEEEEPFGDPSGFCILCSLKGICNEYHHAYDDIERIETQEDAIKLFKQYQICGIRHKQMEEMLKFYVDHNEPIRVSDEEYRVVIKDDIKFDDAKKTIELIKTLEINGSSLYNVVNITNTNMKKFIKKFKLSEEQIDKINETAKKTKKTEYKVIKIEEDVEASDDNEVIDVYF